MANEPTVFIVDDDDAIRDSLRMLAESMGFEPATFATAQAFLEAYDPGRSGCLVLDIRMPGMSGLELQERLVQSGIELPIIFMTGHADVPMAVRAMQAGAVDFLEKPFRDQDLLDKIQRAIEFDAKNRKHLADRDAIRRRSERLTPREREVLELVVDGQPNKAIAAELGLSERTIEIHRSRVMRKMEADSLPQLVQMVLALRRS
jgi:FixJ family two-component response regulator